MTPFHRSWYPALRLIVLIALTGSSVALPRAAFTQTRPATPTATPAAASAPARTPAPPSMPVAKPESVGLSADRLARISSVVQDHVDRRQIAGAVTLIARRGRIAYFNAFGELDRERHEPMPTDAIFRIASMSKAVTSVAAMMLMEEGKLLLDDPVSKFIPAYKQTRVAVLPPNPAAPGATAGSVPATRQITIRDLLTHTAGVSYGTGALEDQYKAANAYRWYCANRDEPIGAIVERLATLPFTAQPGERWVYGFSTDILGHVVEQASGQTLDAFMRTRIFEPLKMVDTSFYLPEAKRGRLATVYSMSNDGVLSRAPDEYMGQGDYVTGPRTCFSGGAGLLSTASDYARFLQMLLNGGDLDGARLLAPHTVALMTSNHVGTLYEQGRFGFGLGFEVVEHVGRAGRLGAVGEFGWGGAYYTEFWVDPQDDLVAVFMTQTLPQGHLDLEPIFKNLVYQAIVAPASSSSSPASGSSSKR